jgi:hypothetical protein
MFTEESITVDNTKTVVQDLQKTGKVGEIDVISGIDEVSMLGLEAITKLLCRFTAIDAIPKRRHSGKC